MLIAFVLLLALFVLVIIRFVLRCFVWCVIGVVGVGGMYIDTITCVDGDCAVNTIGCAAITELYYCCCTCLCVCISDIIVVVAECYIDVVSYAAVCCC